MGPYVGTFVYHIVSHLTLSSVVIIIIRIKIRIITTITIIRIITITTIITIITFRIIRITIIIIIRIIIILTRLKRCLRSWSSRDLTPIWRSVIVKTFALFRLVYLFQVLPNPPNYFVRKLEQVVFNFIWNGNPDKVKRSVTINTVHSGGLKVTYIPSFINSLKSPWIKRYCNDCNGVWK